MPQRAKRPYPHGRAGFWFDISQPKKIRLDHLPNLGFFAVFDRAPDPFSRASRLFVARSPGEFSDKLNHLIAKGALRAHRVYVETAASEADITDPHYEELVWTVLAGIERIKTRGDRATLLRVRAALERKGMNPGPKKQAYATAWKLDTLRNLSKSMPFESAVTHPARKRALESARQELWRYCREFYNWCLLAGIHSPKDWLKPKAAAQFRREFGMNFPRDLDAATEAYKRGKRTNAKHLTAYDRFLQR
ncbi:MAG TPA: hypothetical protein VKG84_02005 [Candidatus Acidoferrales bacterium]|nr:hypothetical protein [Candidatus Acidoferrales bacterium]